MGKINEANRGDAGAVATNWSQCPKTFCVYTKVGKDPSTNGSEALQSARVPDQENHPPEREATAAAIRNGTARSLRRSGFAEELAAFGPPAVNSR